MGSIRYYDHPMCLNSQKIHKKSKNLTNIKKFKKGIAKFPQSEYNKQGLIEVHAKVAQLVARRIRNA